MATPKSGLYRAIAALLLCSSSTSLAAAAEVRFLSVTGRDGRHVIEWWNPETGPYATTRIIGRPDRFAVGPNDTIGAFVADVAGSLGSHDSIPNEPVPNGTPYYYTAYVHDGAGGFSSGVRARGLATLPSAGAVWVFAAGEGGTSMAPPGIGGVVMAVSNDGNLYALKRGVDGGRPPAGWTPFSLPLPAQHRPPVIAVSGITGADSFVLLGSQDGVVRAVDAATGDELWTSEPLGMVQASPAASFRTFGATKDLVFVGSRNAGVDNLFHAMKAGDGSDEWTYQDDDGGFGLGIVNGGASVDYLRGRVYFASHERVPGAFTVFAVTIDNGGLVWRRALGDVTGSPILRGDVLYVGADDGRIYALDVDDGSDRATPFETFGPAPRGFLFPDFYSERIYFSSGGVLWCLTHTGTVFEKVWSLEGLDAPSIPVYPPGSRYLWFGGGGGRLHQVDVFTGDASNPPDSKSVLLGTGLAGIGSPSVDLAQGLIYVGSEDGAIYAVPIPLTF